MSNSNIFFQIILRKICQLSATPVHKAQGRLHYVFQDVIKNLAVLKTAGTMMTLKTRFRFAYNVVSNVQLSF